MSLRFILFINYTIVRGGLQTFRPDCRGQVNACLGVLLYSWNHQQMCWNHSKEHKTQLMQLNDWMRYKENGWVWSWKTCSTCTIPYKVVSGWKSKVFLIIPSICFALTRPFTITLQGKQQFNTVYISYIKIGWSISS